MSDGYEIWVDVKGFEDYQVSNMGEVRRKGKKGVRAHGILKNGYHSVSLSSRGKRASKYVHKLVADAFLLPVEGTVVTHKDGVKSNNRLDNLERKFWSKPVVCTSIEDGSKRYYKCMRDAEVDGFTSQGISSALNGRVATHRKHTWALMTNNEVEKYGKDFK